MLYAIAKSLSILLRLCLKFSCETLLKLLKASMSASSWKPKLKLICWTAP